MAKKLGVLTSVVLGIAGGTAAALFLATESGKKVKSKVTDFVKDYQENPESVHAEFATKAQELKNQAVDKFTTVKGQFESGELTVEDLMQTGKQRVQQFAQQMKENFSDVQEAAASVDEEANEILTEDELVVQEVIEIDLEDIE